MNNTLCNLKLFIYYTTFKSVGYFVLHLLWFFIPYTGFSTYILFVLYFLYSAIVFLFMFVLKFTFLLLTNL